MANLDAMVTIALEEQGQAFTDINKSQMALSIRSDDHAITPLYSPAYAKKKGFTHPDLKVKGDFQDDMFFQTDGREFFITSSDVKMPWLVDHYSEKLFGIAPVRQQKAQGIALSSLARLYNKMVLDA